MKTPAEARMNERAHHQSHGQSLPNNGRLGAVKVTGDSLYQEMFTSNKLIVSPQAVFHTEGGVPWDFPPQSSSFPPQDLLPLLYFVLLSHPKWHQLPNIVISKAIVLYETLVMVCKQLHVLCIIP